METARVRLFPRRAVLGIGAGLLLPGPARAQTPRITVEITPELAEADKAALRLWADRVKAKIALWWPILTTALRSPGFTPSAAITLSLAHISPSGVPAMSFGDTIVVDVAGLLPRRLNPDTQGMIAHELVHVAQHYPEGQPGWLTEGIADYLRYYVLIPDQPGRAFDPAGVDWRTGYQPTAGLLDFVERAHPGAVREINAALRTGGNGPATLARIGGAPVEQLWAAYTASRPAAENAEAARRQAQLIHENTQTPGARP